jgi:hypothetical protein
LISLSKCWGNFLLILKSGIIATAIKVRTPDVTESFLPAPIDSLQPTTDHLSPALTPTTCHLLHIQSSSTIARSLPILAPGFLKQGYDR